MNIILFIVILGVLVFVHELGHFLFAKMFGIRVDEFGFGYPPRAKKIGSWRGTEITLNWIPFGGFVKIFGEDDKGVELSEAEKKVSLVYKPRWQQLLVMFGGILFNIVFAMILFVVMYTIGVPSSSQSAPTGYEFDELALTVTGIMPESPAMESGLQAGDIVKEYYNSIETVTVTDQGVEDLARFIDVTGEQDDTVGLVVLRNEKLELVNVAPELGVVDDHYGIGISLEMVGELKLPIGQAISYGVRNTFAFIGAIVRGFGQLIVGHISFNNLSGPVGIVGQVGQASAIGILYLVGFTAILSLNLAVLNLIPFPALDGGRIIILLIESIIQKRIKPVITNTVNTIGFFVLIGLMIVVTVKDIVHLF